MCSSKLDPLNVREIEQLLGEGESLVEKLIEWGLVPKVGEYKCPKCGGELKLRKDALRTDGVRWVCEKKVSVQKQKARPCTFKATFRKGTFFANSHLPIWKILGFASLWVNNVSLRVAAWLLKIGAEASVDWASYCREVVFQSFFQYPEKLGGEGVEVEIDESKFGRCKYNRGHWVEGQWVFGGYERGSGRIFMVAVEDCGAETLIPIIEDWIKPHTTIISDFWKAYDCLKLKGYVHLKVNHSLHFKDPETGAHTNCIESSWRAAKATFSGQHRCKAHIPGNLARYMFQKRCRTLQLDPTLEFFRLEGQVYDAKNQQASVERGTLEDYEKDSDDDAEE